MKLHHTTNQANSTRRGHLSPKFPKKKGKVKPKVQNYFNNSTCFEQLPAGPKTLILQHLNGQDLQAVGSVNKSLRELSENPKLQGNQEWFEKIIAKLPTEGLIDFLNTPKAKN